MTKINNLRRRYDGSLVANRGLGHQNSSSVGLGAATPGREATAEAAVQGAGGFGEPADLDHDHLTDAAQDGWDR